VLTMKHDEATTIDPRQALLLAAHVGCDVRTARRWLSGDEVRGHVLGVRLVHYAARLGLTRRRPKRRAA
jgi:hypothetical protein